VQVNASLDINCITNAYATVFMLVTLSLLSGIDDYAARL